MNSAVAQSVERNEARPGSGEHIEIVARPAERAMIIVAFPWLVATGLIGLFCLAASAGAGPIVLLLPLLLLLGVLLAASIVLMVQRFELTESRVRESRGVFSRVSVDVRLDHVRNITVTRSFLERVLALGTIHMTTAGAGPAVVWRYVSRPQGLCEKLRRSIDAANGREVPGRALTSLPDQPIDSAVAHEADPNLAQPRDTIGGPPQAASATPAHEGANVRLPVIGIAGGIGAGKSTVARAFERMGCHVIDSDARAKAALDRPEVRDRLVQWWGASVLTSEQRIDRGRVAQIIFTNPEERARLEQLIHPLVREDRVRMIDEARAAGARAVIVDAPLLFEAGIDKECDVVVFVDAPRAQRIERVRQTRGWEPAELERRESAQLSLDEKRRRSQYVIENRSRPGDVEGQVQDILGNIEEGPESGDLPLPA